MEIVIAGVVLALGLVVAAALLAKRPAAAAVAPGRAKPPAPAAVADGETAARRAEATRLEERLHGREEALDARGAELAERERRLAEKEAQVTEVREKAVRQLERSSGLSASQAKASLMRELDRPGPPRDAPARCARSRRRPSATPSGACARSSRWRCSAWPRATPPRRRSPSSSCRPTT